MARSFLGEGGVVAFSEGLAAEAAEAIGVTAAGHQAVLLTRNSRDFAGIPGLQTETTKVSR